MGFLSFYGSVRGFTVADQDLQQSFHQAPFVLLLMPPCSLDLGCASQSTANSPLADAIPSNGHISKYSNKFPAISIYLVSCGFCGYFYCWLNRTLNKKKTRPDFCVSTFFPLRRCSRVCRVAVSHEEYCFLKGSRGCVTLNLTGSATVEPKLCEPRMKLIGCEGDCGVPARLSVRITACLPCEVCMFISGIGGGNKGPRGFLFIPLQNNYLITRCKN